MQRSSRFARFLSSRRVLQVRLSKDLRYEKSDIALDHLSSRFVLCGRVFVPFASKEGSAYMMEVNEDEDRSPDDSQGDDTRISLWDFIELHNPPALNQNQVRVLRHPCLLPEVFVAAHKQMVDPVRLRSLYVCSSPPF
jgi:RNA-dependent RNA polymerase